MTRFLLDSGIAGLYLDGKRGVYERAEAETAKGNRIGTETDRAGVGSERHHHRGNCSHNAELHRCDDGRGLLGSAGTPSRELGRGCLIRISSESATPPSPFVTTGRGSAARGGVFAVIIPK